MYITILFRCGFMFVFCISQRFFNYSHLAMIIIIFLTIFIKIIFC